jgi:hypothetical protein
MNCFTARLKSLCRDWLCAPEFAPELCTGHFVVVHPVCRGLTDDSVARRGESS